MNIHEYQAKQLFERFRVPSPKGIMAQTPEEAKKAANALQGDSLVIKAQIHAGGRGKGTFTNGFKGGVHLCSSAEEIEEKAGKMLGQTLVTHQTGAEGRLVNQVLIAESVSIKKELYLAILLDRSRECPVIIVSQDGGVDIEEVAENNPEKIYKELIDPSLGLLAYQTRKISKKLGLSGDLAKQASTLLNRLYTLFIECDCSQVEINPLVITDDERLLALDAKLNFDANALYRQSDIADFRDPEEEDPREVEASEYDLNYIGLDGNIGCMVNGAGLAMSTMDIIQHHGGSPANFLDVGGGANEEQVKQAFRILSSDPNVKAILVNIFGGIMQCDVIAQGIINAAKEIQFKIPLIVRLEGTNVERGRALLEDSSLSLITAGDLTDAAQKAVKAAA